MEDQAMADNELFEKGLKERKQILGTDYVDANLAGSDDFMAEIDVARESTNLSSEIRQFVCSIIARSWLRSRSAEFVRTGTLSEARASAH